jgi:hypothetical protein
MRSRYFPRIPPRRDERGAVSLAVVLLFIIFSGLGLSMIFLSQVYLRIGAWRKASAVLDAAAENGVKTGFEDLAARLNEKPSLVPLEEERIEEVRSDPETGFPRLLEESLAIPLPLTREEAWEKMRWRSAATCSLRGFEDLGPYLKIRAGFVIEAEGGLDRQPARRTASLDTDLVLLAGWIPLSSFPLLIDKEADGGEARDFAAENGISLVAVPSGVVEPGPVLTGGGVIPEDATPMLGRALNIDILRPQDLPASRLRPLLGLEESAEPVPDGVYLIRNDLGLGGIFVQGDLDEMITAIEGDFQIVVFRMEAGEWTLRFSPALGRTEFTAPAAVESFDLVPLGMIIVNGRILSLAGGAVGPDGEIEAVTDRELPSVLGGIALTIVASDKVTLTSHLILQNVSWRDGIPMVKDPQSQVVIYSTGHDVLTGAGREGGIAVAAEAPAETRIQASLTASGGGFEILGGGKTVELLGGLQAVDYAGEGNALRVLPDPRRLAGVVPGNGPLSAVPLLSVLSLQIMSWKES